MGNGGKNLLMIFDGYDELTYEQRENDSIFLDIICGRQLPNCAVLVTSRPYASNTLKQLSTINRHVEVVGFSKEQIYACIRKNITDQSSVSKLIALLEEREDITSLCYIPLNCVIMIHIYKQNKVLPTTMTKLFAKFILDSVTREIKIVRKESLNLASISDFKYLPKDASDKLIALSKLAYSMLAADRFVFTYEELRSAFSDDNVMSHCLGLVTCLSSISDPPSQHYQFLHLSIQEFLAAKYAVATMQHEEQVDVLRKYINNPRFRLFLLFYVGMANLMEESAHILFYLGMKREKSNEYDDLLEFCEDGMGKINFKAGPKTDKDRKPDFFYFAHLIFESQKIELFKYLLVSLKDKNIFSIKHCKLTQFDCMLLAQFFCSIEHSWEKLELISCSLKKQSLMMFDQVRQRKSAEKMSTFKIINLSDNDPEMIVHIHLFPWLRKAEELKFECGTCPCQLNGVTANFDADSVLHIPKLSIRHGNPREDEDLRYRCALCLNTTTNKVSMCRTKVGANSLLVHLEKAETVKLMKVDSTVLQQFKLHDSLGSCTLREVDGIDLWISKNKHALACSRTLHTLKLCSNSLHLHSRVAIDLFQSLEKNSSIRELNLSICIDGKDHHLDVGQAFRKFLSVNSTLKKLEMHNNIINDYLGHDLMMGLSKNKSITDLDISGNHLSIDMIQNFVKVLKSLFLQELSIEGAVLQRSNSTWALNSRVRGVTARLYCALAHFGHIRLSVNHLFLSDNDLSSSEYLRIFNSLQKNQATKELFFSRNLVHIANNRSIGFSLMQMLIINNTLHSINFEAFSVSDMMCEYLAAGLSSNTSVRKLSLNCHAVQSSYGIATILKALKYNYTIKELDLSSSGDLLVKNDCALLASDFQSFLENNSCLVNLNLQDTYITDTIAGGIANGLSSNNSLESLKVTFSQLTCDGVTKLVSSMHKGSLTQLDAFGLCQFSRKQGQPSWDFIIHNESLMWPLVHHIFGRKELLEQFEVRAFIIKEYSMIHQFQAKRIFSILSCSNLREIDLSQQSLYFDTNYKNNDKHIGNALKELLISSSFLEILKLKACHLPSGTWRYAAQGLKQSKSLKTLDLSQCDISAYDAHCILRCLQSSNTLKYLDLSENKSVMNELNSKLKDAFEKFVSSSSVQFLYLKDSVGDEVAMGVVAGLQRNAGLKKLSINEQYLSCETLKQLLLLLKCSEIEQLDLTEISLSTCTPCQDFWSNIIEATIVKSYSLSNSYVNSCKSSKVFGSLCNIQNEMDTTFFTGSTTQLEINMTDSDIANTVFRSLTLGKLPYLEKMALNRDHYRNGSKKISGSAVGQNIRDMLARNKTLVELCLCNFDEDVMEGIIDGLPNNSTLKSLFVDFKSLNDTAIAKLLRVLDTPSIGLLKMKIDGVPPIHRTSIESSWSMALDKEQKMFVNSRSFPNFPRFICTLCKICDGFVSPMPSSSATQSILSSWPYLELSNSRLDITFTTELLTTLTSNCTITGIDISNNKKLILNGDERLSESLQALLEKNKFLQFLKISGSLNDTTAIGLAAGLKHNHTLQHLCIDADVVKIKNLSEIMHSLTVCGLTFLEVSNVCYLRRCQNSLWQIKIDDRVVFSHFISVLGNIISPNVHLLKALRLISKFNCDIYCETIDFQMSLTVYYDLLISKKAQRVVTHYNDSSQYSDGDVAEYFDPSLLGAEIQSIFTDIDLLSLKLNRCILTDRTCRAIVSGLSSAHHLVKLDLGRNSIHLKGFIELLKVLNDSKSKLEEMDMSHTSLMNAENKGAASKCLGIAIENMLANNATLKVLNLKHCGICDLIVQYIGDGLLYNHTLEFLNLSCNNFSNDGAKALFHSIERNDSLRGLDLSNNILLNDDLLGQSLCSMLECNKTLTSLNLKDSIDDAVLRQLVAGLENNTTLQTLNLDVCSFVKFTSQVPKLHFLNMGLSCVGISDMCSFSTSQSCLKLEIRNRIPDEVLKFLCQSDYVANEVVVSKDVDSELNLDRWILNINTLTRLCQSVKESKLKKLSLNLSKCTDFATLGEILKNMLIGNSTLADLHLYGAINDTVAEGLIAGLRANDSITTLFLDVHNLCNSTINDILLCLGQRKICYHSCTLFPIFTIVRSIYNEKFPGLYIEKYYQSRKFLIFFCKIVAYKEYLFTVFNSAPSTELNVSGIDIDDSLGSLIFASLENSSVHVETLDLSNNPKLKCSDENCSHALERMLTCNKYLKCLKFNESVNNLLILAIAQGLKENQFLQVLDITTENLGDDALIQLLQSLGIHPLTIVDIQNQSNVRFVRSTSESWHDIIEDQLKSEQESIELCSYFSSRLARLLKLLKVSGNLQELSVYSCNRRNHQEMKGTIDKHQTRMAIQELLKCSSLKVLKIFNPLTVGVLDELPAGLRDNGTLQSLAVNTQFKLSIDDVSEMIKSCAVSRLEFMGQYLFLRDPPDCQWKIKILYRTGTPVIFMKEIYRTIGNEVDSISARELEYGIAELKLDISSENGRMICDVADSIECGNFQIEKLKLKFFPDSHGCKHVGVSIKKMLKGKSLKQLFVVGLRDAGIEDDLISGLSQTATLTQLSIQEDIMCIESNQFVRKLLSADFSTSSVIEIHIGNNVSFEKGEKRSPEDAMHSLRSIPRIEPDPLLVDNSTWIVKNHSDKKLELFSIFVWLSRNFNSLPSSISQLAIKSLNNLNLSHSSLNSNQLSTLFKTLSQGDAYVTCLDVSYCYSAEFSDSHCQSSLQEMLERNKTLEVLDLTGNVDDGMAAAIIIGLPRSSLKCLSIDLTITAYTFYKVEDIIRSFANSTLNQLCFTGVCIVQKHKFKSSWCIDLVDYHCASTKSLWQRQMLYTWSSLFVLETVSKVSSNSSFTICATGPIEHISLKIFQMYFRSASQVHGDYQHCTVMDSLNELCLVISLQNRGLVVAITESLCHNTTLKELDVVHDTETYIDFEAVSSSYKWLLSLNQTLKVISIMGKIDDEIVCEIAEGLQCNSTLRTLKFSASVYMINPETLARLLQSAHHSGLMTLHLSDGCDIYKCSEDKSWHVSINKSRFDCLIMCKLFCASVQIQGCSRTLLASLLPNDSLDLTYEYHNDFGIKGTLASTLFECVARGSVSELILTGNDILRECEVDDVCLALEGLLSSKTSVLQKLKLDSCGITDLCCESIAKEMPTNEVLKCLDLSSNISLTICGVGKFLSSLTHNSSLVEVNLSSIDFSKPEFVSEAHSKVCAGIVDMLKTNKTLLRLLVDKCDGLCLYIAKGLASNTALKVLSMYNLKKEVKIFESLEVNNGLEELDMEGSEFTLSVGSAIECMLVRNKNLTILNLSRCEISDDACKLIAVGLAENKHLHTLDLSGNKICGSGIVALFQVLEDNVCKLCDLNLSSNTVYPQFDIVRRDELLGKNFLRANRSLKVLAVSELSHFDEWLGLELFKGLKYNTTLSELDISANYQDEETLSAFVDMIAKNQTITTLNVRYHQCDTSIDIAETLLKSSSLQKVIVDPLAKQHYESVYQTSDSEIIVTLSHLDSIESDGSYYYTTSD